MQAKREHSRSIMKSSAGNLKTGTTWALPTGKRMTEWVAKKVPKDHQSKKNPLSKLLAVVRHSDLSYGKYPVLWNQN